MFDRYSVRAVTAMILWSVAGTLFGLLYYNHSIGSLGLKEIDAISNMLNILVIGAVWGTVLGPLFCFPPKGWIAHSSASAVLLFMGFFGPRFAVMANGRSIESFYTMYFIFLGAASVTGLVGSWLDSRRSRASPRSSDS